MCLLASVFLVWINLDFLSRNWIHLLFPTLQKSRCFFSLLQFSFFLLSWQCSTIHDYYAEIITPPHFNLLLLVAIIANFCQVWKLKFHHFTPASRSSSLNLARFHSFRSLFKVYLCWCFSLFSPSEFSLVSQLLIVQNDYLHMKNFPFITLSRYWFFAHHR